MALSYSGITSYGKVSLPSVDSWGTNNNILKDPPKSITTRRIDKVSENSFIVAEIDGSSDRAAEAILAYPRGINPMVGVSYTDNNGGVGRGQALLYGQRYGKLPYRVADHGAFRAPILRPFDLYPLSRLPRNVTKIDPIVSRPDFSKKITCKPEARALTDQRPRFNYTSTASYKVEHAAEINTTKNIKDKVMYSVEGSQQFPRANEQHVKYTAPHIKDNLQGSFESNTSTIQRKFALPKKGVANIKDKVQPQASFAGSQTTRARKFVAPSTITNIKDTLRTSADTNIRGAGLQKRTDPNYNTHARAERVRTEATTNKTGNTRHNNMHSHLSSSTTHDTTLRASAQSAISRQSAGGVGQHDMSRDLSTLYKIQSRGAIVLPDNTNMGYKPSMDRENLGARTRDRLIPVART